MKKDIYYEMDDGWSIRMESGAHNFNDKTEVWISDIWWSELVTSIFKYPISLFYSISPYTTTTTIINPNILDNEN